MATEKVIYIEPWALDNNTPTSFLSTGASTTDEEKSDDVAESPITKSSNIETLNSSDSDLPTPSVPNFPLPLSAHLLPASTVEALRASLSLPNPLPASFLPLNRSSRMKSTQSTSLISTTSPSFNDSDLVSDRPLPPKMPHPSRVGELWACPVCKKGFRQRSNVEVHYRIHTGERPYACRHCGKAFTQQSNCRKHEATHLNEKAHECSLCGKRFVQSNNLRKHIMIHSGEKPLKCGICGKAFAQASNLRKHEQAHRNERLFACQLCPRSFVQSSNLKKHVEIVHARIRRFYCLICNQRAGLKSNLLRHVAQVHGYKERSEAVMYIARDTDDHLEGLNEVVPNGSVDSGGDEDDAANMENKEEIDPKEEAVKDPPEDGD